MQVNREKLSEVLGCSLRTIDEYRRQGMPGEAPKRPGDQWRFESGTVVQWLRDRERQSAIGEIAQIDEGEARRRKMAADAANAEFDLAKKEGAAVAIEDFTAAWSSMIGAARGKLLGFGARLGPIVALSNDPAECEAHIDSALKEALQELSEIEPEIQINSESNRESSDGGEELEPHVGSPTGPDRKRVGGRGKKA